MGPLQHDMLIAFREAGGRKPRCSHSSHITGIISSMCFIISSSVKGLPASSAPLSASIKQSNQSLDNGQGHFC